MDILGMFGRRSIRDPASLATFIDEQALTLSARRLEDYARGRAGAEAGPLFAMPAFRAALEKARWEAYPRALAMVAELTETELHRSVGVKQDALLAALIAMVVARFDRHTPPQSLSAADWSAARGELARSLASLARERPRTLDAIAAEHASFYLAIMPLDARIQPDDFPSLRNQLQASLISIRERLLRRANLPALAEKLAALASKPPATEAAG